MATVKSNPSGATPETFQMVDSTSSLAEVDALLLAGGLGTRLRSVSGDTPKVLVPIAGRPFLTYLLDQLAQAGVRHVVLCTGYRASLVRDTLGDQYGPMRLSYSEESTPLGTGGALRAALNKTQTPTILALNGDSYCHADLRTLHQFHRDRNALASLLLAEVPNASRFGRVTIDEHSNIQRFAEKTADEGPGRINAGIYLLSRELIAAIPESRAVSLERDVFPTWIGNHFLGYPVQAPFLDIGIPESLAQAESFLRSVGLDH